MFALGFRLLFIVFIHATVAWKVDEFCEKSNNLTTRDLLPQYTISLETPPERRWVSISKMYQHNIHDLLKFIEGMLGKITYQITLYFMRFITHTIPSEYISEMKGIAIGANVSLESVVLMNVFYELTTLCTSIVARHGITREIYHARNLDFGISTGFDSHTNSWTLTDLLRDAAVEVTWTKNDHQIAKSTHFVGYVGFLTAMSNGAFTYSMNQRYSEIPSFWNLIFHAFGVKSHFIGFVARNLVLKQASYEIALETLSTVKLIAPCYIMIGSSVNKAAMLTRGKNSLDAIELLDKSSKNWYLFVTNFDKNSTTSFWDSRGDKCKNCLHNIPHSHRKTATDNLSKALLNVLSTKPILNKLTIYTTSMMLSNNRSNSYSRKCQDPCPLI